MATDYKTSDGKIFYDSDGPTTAEYRAKEHQAQLDRESSKPAPVNIGPYFTEAEKKKMAAGREDRASVNRHNFPIYLERANNGDTEAMVWIGNYYHYEEDSSREVRHHDEEKALPWYFRAYSNGNKGCAYQIERALKGLEVSIETKAEYNLGLESEKIELAHKMESLRLFKQMYKDVQKGKPAVFKPTKGKLQFSDGVYKGDLLYYKPNGKGVFKSKDGSFYEGEWLDGKKHGKGKYTFSKKEYYEGDWVEGKRHGKGKYVYETGDVYEGEYVNDKMHGRGKATLANGTIKDGYWENDEFKGSAQSTTPAQTAAPSSKPVKGKKTFDDGSVYEGDLVNGKMHGKGKYAFADGSFYEGDFVNNRCQGKGKLSYSNGDVHEGDFVDGERNGKGKYTYADGRVYIGEFANGNFNGNGKKTYPDGRIQEGRWKDDEFMGKP